VLDAARTVKRSTSAAAEPAIATTRNTLPTSHRVAVLGIDSHLARNDAIEAAATIAGYLEANHSGFGRAVPAVEAMLKTVRQHIHGDEWMARGAAMDRDQMVAFVVALLPQ
jgi:uncharacterized membrane protein